MPAAACPPPQQLRRLLLGQTDDATAATLERHVEGCDHCSGLLPALGADDALVEAMRSAPPSALSAEERAAVEELSRLLLGPLAGRETRTENGTDADGPRAGPTRLDFLAPAQGPDEIGRLGAYRVLSVLGQGGMGIVLEAEDTQLRRRVAVKVLQPGVASNALARERFLREARVAAQIEHDNVIAVHQVGEEGGVPFLVMPLLQGESLETWLKRCEAERPRAPADPAEVLRLGREIAQGLEAAHERGLIHRDIKPGNVWLEARPGGPGAASATGGRVKLLDFGLARPVEGEQQLTGSGVLVGTPAYMSPEQARGGGVDARADLWGLGCVLYRLCSGRVPFAGPDAMATLIKAALDAPPPLRQLNSAVPPELEDLVGRLLAKDPNDRPATARAVAEELRRIERQRRTGDATTEYTAPPVRRRFAWAVAGGLLLAVVAAGALAIRGIAVSRGEKEGARSVPPLRGPVAADEVPAKNPATELDRWVEDTRKLPPDALVRAVADKLKERNPGFDGNLDAGQWRTRGWPWDFSLCTDHVTDIGPLRALAHIPKLHLALNGSAPGKGRLADLSPLRLLPNLKLLQARGNPITDLRPLQGLRVDRLYLTDVWVADLRPLDELPFLHTLHLTSAVRPDLGPLWRMRLIDVYLDMPPSGPGEDLKALLRSIYSLKVINAQTPIEFWKKYDPGHAALLQWVEETRELRGTRQFEAVRAKMKERNRVFDGDMKPTYRSGELRRLRFLSDHVTDLVALRGAGKLSRLTCNGSANRGGRLADLAPLRGLNLSALNVNDTRVHDLWPLRGNPLREIEFQNTPVTDVTPLRRLRLLRNINLLPVADFWKQVEAGKLPTGK